MTHFLGIDVSTTASKALVINTHGQVAASHTVLHPGFSVKDKPLWSEQNPTDWWSATSAAIQAVLTIIPPDQIAAIGLTGQMQGLVLLDENNEVLRPAILWNDQRSSVECEEITTQFGNVFLCQHIGSALLPCHIAPKLQWVKKHEPHVYQRITHILLPKDYIRFRLSGVFATDKTDASGLALMNIEKRDWSTQLIDGQKISRDWLPMLFESSEIASHVYAEGAAETGLKIGTPIAAGAGDQPAQSIGCGMVKPNMMSLQVGTSGVTSSLKNKYVPDKQGRFLEYCHADSSQWLSMGLTAAAAGSLRWFKNTYASNMSFSALDEMASTIEQGAKGLIFIPDISGNIHPWADPLARGAFIGLTHNHTLAHMARALMEGVSFSLYELVELMCESSNIQPDSFLISGGAANSSLWKLIFAEIVGKPLYPVQINEGAAFGAAIIAGVAIGYWSDFKVASNALIKNTEVITPDNKNIERYRKLYPIWKEAFLSLQNINHQLATFTH